MYPYFGGNSTGMSKCGIYECGMNFDIPSAFNNTCAYNNGVQYVFFGIGSNNGNSCGIMACYLNHPVSRLRYDLGYIYMEYHTHYLEEILTNVHGVVYVHMLCLHLFQLHIGILALHKWSKISTVWRISKSRY